MGSKKKDIIYQDNRFDNPALALVLGFGEQEVIKWLGVALSREYVFVSGSAYQFVREEEMLEAIARHLGIKYEYADTGQETATETIIELSKEMLADLPVELLEELRRSAQVLDRSSLSGLTERIDVYAPDTAKALKTLIDNFQFGKIQNLIKEIE